MTAATAASTATPPASDTLKQRAAAAADAAADRAAASDAPAYMRSVDVDENIAEVRKLSMGNSSFRSNWHNDPNAPKDWSAHLLTVLDLWPLADDAAYVDPKAPVPYLSPLTHLRWALFRAAPPFLIQYAISYIFNDVLYKDGGSPVSQAGINKWAAIPFYMLFYYFLGLQIIWRCRDLGAKYGYFDSATPRDQIPDAMGGKVAASLLLTVGQRVFMEVMTTWDSDAKPSIGWQLPVQMAVYAWTLDFYYYWYHRIMHESDSLWPFHRTHHLARHPNTLLTLFADDEQELFDMVGIPFLTWLTMSPIPLLRLNFYEWWFCNAMVTVVEIFGHAGVRMYFTAFQAFPFLLQPLEMDITMEDHDIHHRRGWKHSGNYGKQTRMWDRIFGTVIPRDEGPNENIDRNLLVEMPW